MATTFKRYGKELVHDLLGGGFIDEASGHHEYVGIVMLADQVCDLLTPSHAGTNHRVLVERHRDALSAAADGNAGEYLAALHTLGQSVSKVGIVARCLTVGAVVLISISFLLEILDDILLEGVSGMVRG